MRLDINTSPLADHDKFNPVDLGNNSVETYSERIDSSQVPSSPLAQVID